MNNLPNALIVLIMAHNGSDGGLCVPTNPYGAVCTLSHFFFPLPGVQESDRRTMERPERCRYPTSSLVKKAVRHYDDWDTELYQWPKEKKVIEDRDGEVRIFDLQRWCNFSSYPNNKRSRWLTGDAIVAYLNNGPYIRAETYKQSAK